jgi:hypothetical protein
VVSVDDSGDDAPGGPCQAPEHRGRKQLRSPAERRLTGSGLPAAVIKETEKFFGVYADG